MRPRFDVSTDLPITNATYKHQNNTKITTESLSKSLIQTLLKKLKMEIKEAISHSKP